MIRECRRSSKVLICEELDCSRATMFAAYDVYKNINARNSTSITTLPKEPGKCQQFSRTIEFMTKTNVVFIRFVIINMVYTRTQ